MTDKVAPAFGDRGAQAIAALVRRDLPRSSVRYIVAESDGTVVGTTRLALRQEAGEADIRPIAHSIGWWHALRGALVLGLLAHARLAPDEAYVEELAVRADRRRHGIGRSLLLECESIARHAGKNRITLWVTAGNVGAVALYRSLGYRVTRRRRTLRGRLLFGAPLALLMEKPLGAATASLSSDAARFRTNRS